MGFGRALLVGTTLAAMTLTSCTALDRDARVQEEQRLVQEAYARGDYEAAYRVIALSDRDGYADATFLTGWYLIGGLEFLAGQEQEEGLDWYRRDLMMRIPLSERYRVGWEWIRRAAYMRSVKAERHMAGAYEYGNDGFPKDAELWRCFEDAMSTAKDPRLCKPIEEAKGYDKLILSWPVPKDASWRPTDEALASGDLDSAYRLFLSDARKGDKSAEAMVAFLLLYATWGSIDDVPSSDRVRVGLTWLRKAAHDGSHGAHGALHQLSMSYRLGLSELPCDAELAACFKNAQTHAREAGTCFQMERDRGYVAD